MILYYNGELEIRNYIGSNHKTLQLLLGKMGDDIKPVQELLKVKGITG